MGNNINQRNLVRLAGLNQIQSNMGADMPLPTMTTLRGFIILKSSFVMP